MSKRIHQCDLCGKIFICSRQLSKHRKIHSGLKPFECKNCQQKFTQKNNLKRHLRVHTGEKPYKCTNCEKKFADQSVLKRHEKIHIGLKCFECDLCQKKFARKDHLKSHIIEVRVNQKSKPYKCIQCNKSYTTINYLKNHEKNIHSAEPKFFEREHCKKKYILESNSKKHVQDNLQHNQSFGDFNNLSKHENILNSNSTLNDRDEIRDCDQSNMSFYIRKSVIVHTRDYEKENKLLNLEVISKCTDEQKSQQKSI